MTRVRVNSVDLEYESIGRESDPAILLIMGFASQLTSWPDSLCNGLAAQGLRVIRFDNRDIGRSTHLAELGAPNLLAMVAKLQAGQPVAAPYCLDDMAADAADLLTALGIDQAHIAGASMGGMIAQLMAIRHPAKTKSLISMMSTAGRPGLPAGRPETFAALMTPVASPSREDRIAKDIALWRVIGSPGFPATDEELRATITRNVDYAPFDPAGIVRQMAAIIAAPPRDDRLKALKLPALVIHGAADPLIPVASGVDTAKTIPGAELLVVPGMAHDFSEAVVPVYLKAIGDFVAKVEGRDPV